VGCLGCLLRAVLAGGLFAVLMSALLAGLYWIAPPPRTTILMLGLDSRPGEGAVTRSDTLILATVDPTHGYVGMLSIPRDLYVNIPGYGESRINAAHIFGESEYPGGGRDLAVRTVEENFGVDIHRTARLNFEAFVALVDAAGGVTIDVPNPISDDTYPTPDYGTMVVEFDAGTQHMDGQRALQYARIRHGSSDFQRAERQQQVIAALARQLAAPRNWWRLPNVYLAFTQNVETDLTILDLAMMAPALVWVGPEGIDRQVIDQEMAVSTTLDNGASVLAPQWGLINPLVDRMFRR
jgi:LCP family protein required for cell wall assembly